MRPMAGVRLTLIAREIETPYSGMLPGLIAGHYSYDQCHIDLGPLSRFAGARLIHDEAVGLDLAGRKVLCQNHPEIAFDLASLDIGSTPRRDVPGAYTAATPVKPIAMFAQRWSRIVERVRTASGPIRIVLVGGGAGGVELSLAVQHRLRDLLRESGRDGAKLRVALVTQTTILPTHNRRVRVKFQRVLAARGIEVHEDALVVRVAHDAVHCADGRAIDYTELLWVTDAGAAPWLAGTGLDLTADGFVAVDDTLR